MEGVLVKEHTDVHRGDRAAPRVTVLMGVYNSAPGMLGDAIDSILSQTFKDFEFLILDDGSDQETTLDHLRLQAACDRRIRFLREPHRGLTATLNRGLEVARGSYIARHDADDWSSPERLQKQVRFLAAHPEVDLCGSAVMTHQENGARLWRVGMPESHEEILARFPRGNPFVHGATMFRRDAARRIGGYRETFRCAQDYDFFWRMAERGAAVNLPETLYHYRYAASSVSARKASEQLAAHRAIQRLAEDRRTGYPEDPDHRLASATAELTDGPWLDRGLDRALLKQADHLMLSGRYRDAWRAYGKLLVSHPGNPMAWGKLARLGVFRAAPFLREACFR